MELPSLVICPSTLCGHWVAEVDKFVSPSESSPSSTPVLRPVLYAGSKAVRAELARRGMRGWANLVVTSYEAVR